MEGEMVRFLRSLTEMLFISLEHMVPRNTWSYAPMTTRWQWSWRHVCLLESFEHHSWDCCSREILGGTHQHLQQLDIVETHLKHFVGAPSKQQILWAHAEMKWRQAGSAELDFDITSWDPMQLLSELVLLETPHAGLSSSSVLLTPGDENVL